MTGTMVKRIGFLDYFLDEWHANSYPQWLRDRIAARGLDMVLGSAWAEIDKPGGLSTADWCERYGMKRAGSIEELIADSDYLIILSPDHPEHHERLSQLALQAGRPIYMDKTFSPDLASGVRMFELAEAHGTPMFSCSSLRYAAELVPHWQGAGGAHGVSGDSGSVQGDDGGVYGAGGAGAAGDRMRATDAVEFMAVAGPGEFSNYAVHQLEMIVAVMGTGAQRVKSLSTPNGRLLVYEYADGCQATMRQMMDEPFQATLQKRDGSSVRIPEATRFFDALMDQILTFFATGQPPVPRAETLEIMAMLEAGRSALEQRDTWVALDSAR